MVVKSIPRKGLACAVMAYKDADSDEARDNAVANFAAENDLGMTEAKTIILFVIGIVIFAALIPTAIATIHAANVTGWSSAETSLWNIFGLIVIGIAVYKLIE